MSQSDSRERPTVVLTGASAGIGFAMLEALSDDAFVLAVSRTRPPKDHFCGVWIRGDLRSTEPLVAKILKTIAAHALHLDGLIHCAGSYGATKRHSLKETSKDEWDDLMSVNARSQFILTTRLLPLLLRQRQAFIAAVTSDAAMLPAPGRIAYGCSKAASYALFRGLAEELVGTGVSVVQLLPAGQIATRGLRQRRPVGFDFTGYKSPSIFKEPIKAILHCRGKDMNGSELAIS